MFRFDLVELLCQVLEFFEGSQDLVLACQCFQLVFVQLFGFLAIICTLSQLINLLLLLEIIPYPVKCQRRFLVSLPRFPLEKYSPFLYWLEIG